MNINVCEFCGYPFSRISITKQWETIEKAEPKAIIRQFWHVNCEHCKAEYELCRTRLRVAESMERVKQIRNKNT